MAFQTNVFRNGEWITQTVNVEAVIKPKTKETRKQNSILKPPLCGILTQTAVKSQLVNFILPVRLRSALHKDIAFIGDHSVEIKELRKDGQLHHVIEKADFGPRIRNASVLGSNNFPADPNVYGPGVHRREGVFLSRKRAMVKTEEHVPNNLVSYFGSPPPESSEPTSEFPPQMLLLVLDTGDCVFLFAKQRADADGGLEFVATRYQSPRTGFVYPGVHLAVAPSSRYMALACTENFFAVYELESHENLAEQHMRNAPLSPVRALRGRALPGVIQKMQFLYPRPGDPNHVILLLIIARGGRSRLVTYEWELGDNLASVLAEPKTGHRVPAEHEMPILIIPLLFQSTFISVSQHEIAVCRDVLHCPTYESFDTPIYKASEYHCGKDQPLWVAWARPLRLPIFYQNQDCTYLAREDGTVVFLEASQAGLLTGISYVGLFKGRISSAFTCLDDQHTDVFIVGGDSGPGGIWQAPARQMSRLVTTIPNLWPAVDFVTTNEFATWSPRVATTTNRLNSRGQTRIRRPDHIYGTSGRGPQGCVTEYRSGLRANICLEMDYESTVRQAWIFRAKLPDTSDAFYLLLSMPDRSDVLVLPQNLSEAVKPDLGASPFNLFSRTLAAAQSADGCIIQVTEQDIIVFWGEKNLVFAYEQILPTEAGEVCRASDASILDDRVAVSTHTAGHFHVYVFKLDRVRSGLSQEREFDLADGEVTCLALVTGYGLLVGVLRESRPQLAKCALDSPEEAGLEIRDLRNDLAGSRNNHGENRVHGMEAISSIAASPGLIVLGTRSGEVITITETNTLAIRVEHFGLTTANILKAGLSDDGELSLFVCCDAGLVLLRGYNKRCGKGFRVKHRVWPVDASDPGGSSPDIDYAVAVDVPSESPESTSILALSGTRILLAELLHKPGLVPRQISIGGTPTKMIYSHNLDCLVVAVNRNDVDMSEDVGFRKEKTTLLFLDPKTGKDIGQATDRLNKEVGFISGLGKECDRIYGLAEWQYTNKGSIWHYILASTRQGRVMVISARRIGPLKIRYKTQVKVKESDQPIYSVLGLDEGIVYCAGDTLHWMKMDLDAKKLVRESDFRLRSRATSLSMINGKLVALTNGDSIAVIDPPRRTEARHAPETATEPGVASGSDNPGPMNQTAGMYMDIDRLRHVDSRPKSAVHMMEIAGTQPEEPLSSIMLVSDMLGQVSGLWVPWQQAGTDCETLFEIELPSSIRRFRRGKTRPIWGQRQNPPKYGRLVSTTDDAEILGVSLDGSMQHFTLLDPEAWRLLRFIQNIAARSEDICPFTYDNSADALDDEMFDPAPTPGRGSELHVDGDVLRRVQEKGILDSLLQNYTDQLAELLNNLEGGIHTANFGGDMAAYIELAYNILDYFLEPVL